LDITLPHNFTAYDYQKPFFRAMYHGCKRAVLIWHRRAGKDLTAWQYMIKEAVKKRGTYYYVFPKYSQVRKVFWDEMDEKGRPYLDYVPDQLIRAKNNHEMKLLLVNGSIIQFIGSDKYDSFRSNNAVGCVFSEFGWHNPMIWTAVFEPVFRKNGGWAVFVSTPAGTNFLKQMYDMAKDNPDWFAQVLTVDDTPIFTKDDMDKIRREGLMSEDLLQQEYYCSFTLGVQGSYYGSYLRDLRDKDQVCKVPHDQNAKVYTAADIGYDDDTAIIFYQLVKNEVHIIRTYQNRKQNLEHYIKYITSLPYIYGGHFFPHDADCHPFSSGLSTREVAAAIGFDVTILPMDKRIQEGIECARTTFPRLWIDEGCKDLLIALENYRAEYDPRKEVYGSKPVHDKFSHMADAFRYACISIKLYADSKQGPSDFEYDNMRDLYIPRFK
jgi:phage terminase large subunit